jgi:hypothetical protein
MMIKKEKMRDKDKVEVEQKREEKLKIPGTARKELVETEVTAGEKKWYYRKGQRGFKNKIRIRIQ